MLRRCPNDTPIVAATLVTLVDRTPAPPPSAKRGRGRLVTYTDRLFLKALMNLIVRQLYGPDGLLEVFGQPTAEMATLRCRRPCQPRSPVGATFGRASPALRGLQMRRRDGQHRAACQAHSLAQAAPR